MRPEILNPLFKPVSSLAGVGPRVEKQLTTLLKDAADENAATVADLLFHLPHQIIDRRYQPTISQIRPGEIATLKIRIDSHHPAPSGNKRAPYKIRVSDRTGAMTLAFFHPRPDWLRRLLPIGEIRYVSGHVEWFGGEPNMVHPDHVVSEDEFAQLPLVEPIYPLTAGLSQKILAKIIKNALAILPELPEWTNQQILEQQHWPTLHEALHRVHTPRDALDIAPDSPARNRLAHDELFAGQLALMLVRERMRCVRGIARKSTGKFADRIRAAFKYPLTNSQQIAIREIIEDIEKPERMLRLLQGDVGSGKTIVALLAMAAAIKAGGQAAIMAPTEILARQHFDTLAPLCQTAGINIAVLTGREKGRLRAELLEKLACGEIDLLVGTHALFQMQVEFKDLAIAVIDEQHRFGVHQRLALGEKGHHTDFLVMTATPIPRTLVLSYFGDMDVSRLVEKPANRKPVQTSVLAIDRLEELLARVAAALQTGEKFYWICPLVDESEMMELVSVTERFASLSALFPDLVGLVHGRMNNAEKDRAMTDFRDGKTRILVATTVIEVGVDVPDATIMIIEHAERFGLTQMHQLRGRVGRGEKPSKCILLYKPPLGAMARARLNVMRDTEDGFRIAEEDLKLRGQGEILGTRQSGAPGFVFADMETHGELVEMARDEAKHCVATNPDLASENGEALRILLYLFGRDRAIRLIHSG
jgi:ATP-dependent DNA helicase RecG